MGPDFGKEVTQIALTLAGIALVAMLVKNSRGVSEIISTTGKTFGGLLSVATMQSGAGNAFSF